MATSVQAAVSASRGSENASAALTFEPFHLPASNQRELGAPHPPGTVTPLALRPSQQGDDKVHLNSVISAIQSLQARDKILTKQLALHGALLFRGLPIHSASDFSAFEHAFGYRPHEIIGIVVDRPLLAPNVAPANEAPREVRIYNHNESPQVPHAPEYIFFYAHRAPRAGSGGETPVSSSLELFHRAREQMPEFIAALAEKGILSRVTYRTGRQYTGGSTLREAFGKMVAEGDDRAGRRAKMEAQIARYGRGPHTTWDWAQDDDGDDVLTLTHHLPAVRTQPGTGLPTLFTALAAYYRNAQQAASNTTSAARAKTTQQLYGDGTAIPEEYLRALAEITDDIRVLHRWERGDVLVFDNIIAQHGREPWEGEQGDRVVLASLFDGDEVPGAYINADWAQVVQVLDG